MQKQEFTLKHQLRHSIAFQCNIFDLQKFESISTSNCTVTISFLKLEQ